MTTIPVTSPQNIPSIHLGTSTPKLGGTVDVTSFINLTSFEAREGSTGNDLEGFIISEANDKLELVELLYNKLPGSANQYMPPNVVVFLMQFNELNVPLSDLSSFTQLSAIATSTNTNMGGNIPTLPSNINVIDFGGCNITGVLPSLSVYTNLRRVWLYANPNIIIPTNWTASASMTNIFLFSCRFSSAEVNTVLIEIDSFGTINGVLDIGGNNANPTGAGLTAKSNLIARGWVVTT
tara:strand:+ start:189 stop:899 length:711 start_codon:yes stop_codon:yes gene_type:complete